ncbi:MAG: hypothetical protein HC835_03525 [Oscillatoriales cyanobacterium RM2_1_1]|nr:hypothetical protein [Oscillatoriales cyanobacterium RM2_1_1]
MMTLKVSSLALATFAGLAIAVPSFAQTSSTIDPLEGFDTYEQDTTTDSGINSQTMFDLIHKAQTGRFNVDYQEAQRQQQRSIQDAAAEFRAKQRQRLQQDGGVAPEVQTEVQQ